MENMEIWDKVKRPPKEALKQIGAGRLKGMTDINPQWRYKAMTETFGPCGIGWTYKIEKLWIEPATDGQVMAFAEIKLMVREPDGTDWSAGVPGVGGSTFIAKEKSGLHSSDECYKMAITDAISVAMKMLGVGADIYAGSWDGSKYKDNPALPPQGQKKGISGMSVDAIKKAIDTECDNPTDLAAWWHDNEVDVRLMSAADQKLIIAHLAEKKAKYLAVPLSWECPRGGKVTAVECGECEAGADCEVHKSNAKEAK